MKIVECVPNFSEGRNMAVIDQITDAIKSVDGVKLVDVDPGEATNRTVVTFIGDVEPVKEAAFRAVKKASELIDMRKHTGAHPRHGATDVCPFVPVSNITMEECVQIARDVGKRIGEELNIPVYLYEEAARKPEWRSLAEVRKGEYEALPEKLGTEEWKPDFGLNEWNEKVAKTGVVTVGAREFLIAYNINLNTRDKSLAHSIALELREAGRNKRGPDGKFIRDENGKPIKRPGLLKATRAIGWYIEEYNIAQVSINLTNYKITPLWKVFETADKVARDMGLRVTGSELVGLLPKEALLECGRHALEKQNRSPGVPEDELIHIAVKSLGLDELYPFDPQKKIIEYQIPVSEKLVSMSVKGFVNEISMPSPAPGGGSVSALAGSIGSALTAMVANLTKPKEYNDPRPKENYDLLWKAASKAQELQAELLRAVDEDTDAFNEVIAAMGLPKGTPEEIQKREEAIENGYKSAARVPLHTMKLCHDIMEHTKLVGELGNPASITDIGVAAMMASAGVKGAAYNVLINLGNIKDQEFVEKMKKDIDQTIEDAERMEKEILKMVLDKI